MSVNMSMTIYGRVDWDIKLIKFGDPDCGDRYDCIDEDLVGCVIMDGGIHDGQVELTITQADNSNCNDTYYGCVDWETGKFQIEIPEPCCIGNECVGANCIPYTPYAVSLTVTNLLACVECVYDYKLAWLLPQIGPITLLQQADPCEYLGNRPASYWGEYKYYPGVPCTGTPTTYDVDGSITFSLNIKTGHLGIIGMNGGKYVGIFSTSYATPSSAPVNNCGTIEDMDYTMDCPTGYFYMAAKSGTINASPVEEC